MKVTVRLFAIARAAASDESVLLELPETATISDVRRALVSRLPKLAPLEASLRFAVNEDYASDDTTIKATDELACIPPVSGG